MTDHDDIFMASCGDAKDFYGSWPRPALIVSDGAYGIGGFPGDPHDVSGLVGWYEPHVIEWSGLSKPNTSLWFWNTEVGWATVHPILVSNGWDYVQLIVWDKGVSHIAGNVNGETIRQCPVVTEVSALYRRHPTVTSPDGTSMDERDWLRSEWERSGLPLCKANEACGVRNAATRKYLTKDHMYYRPPGDMLVKLARYANEHGDERGIPYFSLDGESSMTSDEWDSRRPTWNHENGVTNVWSRPPLHGSERIKRPGGKSVHLNQKPLDLMERQIRQATNPGDVVWEPFGGLGSASVASVRLGRFPCMAEVEPLVFETAHERILDEVSGP